MTMPRHVQAHLINTGVMDHDRVTVNPRPHRCHRCGAVTLSSIDDLAIRADADPTPVSPLGELIAVTTGRRTWGLVARRLVARAGWRIAARPADIETVYAEHRCDVPPLPAPPISPTGPPGPTADTHPLDPPF